MLTIREIHRGVILVTDPSPTVIADLFMRPQEYYESPIESIRGKVFSLDEFITEYTKLMGNFNYDWAGFNVPGKSMKEFVMSQMNYGKLRPCEYLFLAELSKIDIGAKDLDKFYFIGTNTSDSYYMDSIEHELCHAFWNISLDFRNTASEILDGLPTETYDKMEKIIIKSGYDTSVVRDEISAYLTTERKEYFEGMFFDIKEIPKEILVKLKNNFEKFKKIL